MIEHVKKHAKTSVYVTVILALVATVKILNSTIATLTDQIDFLTRLVDTTCGK